MSTQPTAPLRHGFEDGRVIAVSGNTPFLLEGAGRVWLVRSGHIEAFLVRTGDETDRGTRNHFLSAHPGDLLFGMETDFGVGLLASGVVGTEVVELTVEAFRRSIESATDVVERTEAAAMLERWVGAVSAGVTRHILPKPRSDVQLPVGGGAREAASGERVRPQRGIGWVRQEGGSALYIGMEETGGTATMPLPPRIPLSQDTWLQPLQPSRFDAVDTEAALVDGSAWVGLQALHALVLSCELFNSALATVDEYNRLTTKAERRKRAREDSLDQLRSILDGGEGRGFREEVSDDPLFRACAAVGRAAGIALRPPPPRPEESRGRGANPVLEIARSSRVRTRSVTLDRTWWQSDQGPLLGFRANKGDPVALLPVSATRYELLDPVTGERTPVTAQVAGTLAPGAVMFYPSFGDAVVKGAGLVALGLRGCGRDLWRVLAMSGLSGILGLVIPLATGLVFQTIVPQAERGQLVQVAIGVGVVSIAMALFSVTQALAMLRVEGRMDATVNAALMDRILRLPASFFREYSSGDLGTRVIALSTLRQVLSGGVVGTVLAAFSALPSVVILFVFDPRLALIAFGILALTLVITLLAGYQQLQRSRVEQRLEGRLAGLVLEMLTGISKLRVAGAEGVAFGVWARIFSEKRRVAYQAREVTNLLTAYQGVLPLLSLAILYGAVALTLGSGGGMSTGTFLAFSAAFGQVLGASISLGSTAMTLLSVQPLFDRIRPILETPPEVADDQRDPGELSGDIELSRLTFAYDPDGPPVLNDVSFRVRAGEFVAIVGPSGSGKSTLLRLLLGFERPLRGTVQYDGQNLQTLDISAVRRQLGVVLQHSRIMPGSIFRNIVGSTLLGMDDAWEAARRAAIDEDIRQMPMGMHTVISEGAATLSGGQRQRLLIARALAQGPRILFFDEATSALDNRTQAVVSESLESLQATRVVIAHRLTTVIHADCIHVMVAGRIVESGTYRELMDRNGVFRELVERQLG
jgi:NHLM bacteriocin system ABC transporter ATP-binding protein